MLKNRTSLKLLLSCFLATLSQIALTSYATTATNSYHSLNFGFFAFVSFVLITFVIYKAIEVLDKRLLLLSSIGGIILSAFLVVGTMMMKYQTITKKSLLAIILLSFFITALIALFINGIPTINYWLNNNCIERKLSKYLHTDSYKLFFIFWGIIFICFIPALLATWPGIFSYDATEQIGMIDGIVTFTSHHPPIHTLYMGLCFTLGKIISQSNGEMTGMLIYSVTQMIIMSGIFGYICYFMSKNHVSVVLILGSTIFFGLFPLNQIFSVCATKDVIFSGLVLLFVIFTIEFIQDEQKFFSSVLPIIRYIICIILMCLFRNNTIYAFIIFSIIFCIIYKKYLLKSISICLACLVAYIAITGPLYSVLNIQKGDFKEALSVPIQQIASTVVFNKDSLSNEQLNYITEIMGDTQSINDAYIKCSADPEKEKFNTQKFMDDKLYSLSMYVFLGLQCTKSYLYSWINLIIPYFYPNFIYTGDENYINQSQAQYIFYDNINVDNAITKVERNSKLPKLDEIYRGICETDSYQKIPVVSILFSQGFILMLYIASILILIYIKRYKSLLTLLMPALIFCTFLFGPMALTRYDYFLLITIPICLCLIFSQFKINSKCHNIRRIKQ